MSGHQILVPTRIAGLVATEAVVGTEDIPDADLVREMRVYPGDKICHGFGGFFGGLQAGKSHSLIGNAGSYNCRWMGCMVSGANLRRCCSSWKLVCLVHILRREAGIVVGMKGLRSGVREARDTWAWSTNEFGQKLDSG